MKRYSTKLCFLSILTGLLNMNFMPGSANLEILREKTAKKFQTKQTNYIVLEKISLEQPDI